jgi:hypothetical protein
VLQDTGGLSAPGITLQSVTQVLPQVLWPHPVYPDTANCWEGRGTSGKVGLIQPYVLGVYALACTPNTKFVGMPNTILAGISS